jgi:hypothetical protein
MLFLPSPRLGHVTRSTLFQTVAKRALGLDTTTSPVRKAKRTSSQSDMADGQADDLLFVLDEQVKQPTKHNYAQSIPKHADYAVINNPHA